MTVLGALGTGSFMSMGGSAAKKTNGLLINVQSPDEESFIKYILSLLAEPEPLCP
jgi:F-type H+-transporting ATPase subunit k